MCPIVPMVVKKQMIHTDKGIFNVNRKSYIVHRTS